MYREERSHRMLVVSAIFQVLLASFSTTKAQERLAAASDLKRPIGVTDVIESRRLSDSFNSGGVVSFSPDGQHFVTVARKGNVRTGVNDFTLAVFRRGAVFSSSKPESLLVMSSSSNRDAISNVKWSSGAVLYFLGERPGKSSQIYSFNVRTRALKQITNSATPVVNYDVASDGRVFVFAAEKPILRPPRQNQPETIAIKTAGLYQMLTGNYGGQPGITEQEIFFDRRGQPAHRVSLPGQYYMRRFSNSLSVSPDGRFVAIGAFLRQIPRSWAEYRNRYFAEIVSVPAIGSSFTSVTQTLLYDSEKNSLAPILNAPASVGTAPAVRWASDSHSLFLDSYLPLEVSDWAEHEARRANIYPIKVNVPNGEIAKAEKRTTGTAENESLRVHIEQSFNSPPKLYVSDLRQRRRALLMDLNPQFKDLEFGNVQRVEWSVADGLRVEGGLYLPTDFVPGKRYPLVIQTHGFAPSEFSMDGLHEWSSGYAARPMAAEGLVVLQAFAFKDEKGPGEFFDGSRVGATSEEVESKVTVAAFEKAIDYLDGERVIDRNRVGIIGFSRTVCYVANMLTHSAYQIAAAAMVDGVDCGYFQELSSPNVAWDMNQLYGGALPFGKGLSAWLRDSPSFSLDRVNTPVLLVALNPAGILTQWEWYAGLSLQEKPVDFVLISTDQDDRDGSNHLLVKPWERKLAQESFVDWFGFWLQDEEHRDPGKEKQYARWEKLRGRAKSAGAKGNRQ
jgi:dipeptidyl aminopeptidase/acylaminoacyl peptidase